MTAPPPPLPIDAVAVIFSATLRAAGDATAYRAAAAAMETLAAAQPGYLGIEAARGADGFGITVSYWADEDAARRWRDHPAHAAVRDAGRGQWYESYRITIARVTRGYGWARG